MTFSWCVRYVRQPPIYYSYRANPNEKLEVLRGGSCFAWIVRSEANAETISQRLGPLLGNGGDLFVIQIKDAAEWFSGQVSPF
jgi:hypothetical protein